MADQEVPTAGFTPPPDSPPPASLTPPFGSPPSTNVDDEQFGPSSSQIAVLVPQSQLLDLDRPGPSTDLLDLSSQQQNDTSSSQMETSTTPTPSPLPSIPNGFLSPLSSPPSKKKRWVSKFGRRRPPFDSEVTIEFVRMASTARAPLYSDEVTSSFKIFTDVETVIDSGETVVIHTHIRYKVPKGYQTTVCGAQTLAIRHGIHAVTIMHDSDFR